MAASEKLLVCHDDRFENWMLNAEIFAFLGDLFCLFKCEKKLQCLFILLK